MHVLVLTLLLLGWVGCVVGRLWLINGRVGQRARDVKRQRAAAQEAARNAPAYQAPADRANAAHVDVAPVGDDFYFSNSGVADGGLRFGATSAAEPARHAQSGAPRAWSEEHPVVDALIWALAALAAAGIVWALSIALHWPVPPGFILAIMATLASAAVVWRRNSDHAGPRD